jgi:hypothetical protein
MKNAVYWDVPRVFSGMLRHATVVRTDLSEEHIASIFRMTGIGELGTTFAVTSNRRNAI